MADTRLSNSAVTAGTSAHTGGIYSLGGTRITYDWDNFIEIPDIPGKNSASTAQVTGSWNGWTNPAFVIEGIFSEDETDNSKVHLATLRRLCTNNKISSSTFTDTYLYDDVFAPSGVKILVDSFSVDRAATEFDAVSGNQKLLRLTIKARETI